MKVLPRIPPSGEPKLSGTACRNAGVGTAALGCPVVRSSTSSFFLNNRQDRKTHRHQILPKLSHRSKLQRLNSQLPRRPHIDLAVIHK